ncbi:N-acetyldiaminopimelate deacetylase [Gordoniibacillus kamchatkensis]|uniref:N-acetyldiaminopimelate deacetylase n=1 Tax=Gordoniibacillus kamchatkensis TaxID=1590651 RepID=A0ABR5ADS2_9BACL|nr:N-acetyldiaminopimelate deacetylase [Paenibacillus sp. VKM B-2647]KIL39152.1 N-acetyldiaminopimelate deacetylase [Paenibacillus sp. VKM B-2647]
MRRRLHRIPEAGFKEFKTQRLLLDYLAMLPQTGMQIRTWHTGILVHIDGTNPKKRIGYRADMDGLPIEEETSLPFRSLHPGYMHACGHDMHMAIALGVLARLLEWPVDDDVVFLFQPSEEGPSGARLMAKSSEFAEWKPDLLVALHIAPEHPVGTIAVKPGALFAGVAELAIQLAGTGGHAAFPHAANDMVIAASHLAAQLHTIVSRNVDPLDAAVLTIGRIESGTRQNIIADQARLEGTIRAFDSETMRCVQERVNTLVRGIETGFACKAEVDYVGAVCPALINDEVLTRQFMDWARHVDGVRLAECRPAMTGEDYAYFLQEVPGFMFWLGVDSPHGLHHARLDPQEEAIGVAIRLVSEYIAWQSANAAHHE